MTYRMPPEMAEATRLTRLGKLTEATALIQRLLQGEHAPGPASGLSSTTIDAEHVPADAELQCEQLGARFKGPRAAIRPRTSLSETVRRLAAMAKASSLNGGFAQRPVPDPLPDGASFTAASYSNAAGTRNYKLYIPSISSSESSKRLALIVMLHGCTQSPDDFAAGTRMNALAEEQGFLVAYPAQHALANAKHCWNWFKPGDQSRDQGEPSLIAGITQEIMRDHPVDPARVYIAGLSAGGAAAAIMGDAYSDLYAAVGVHSGLPSGAASDLPSAFDAMRVGAAIKERSTRIVPTIIFHGDNDPVVHPRNGDAVAAQALGPATGLRQTTQHGRAPGGHTYRRNIYADAEGRTICEQWKIREAGHAWAGGSPSGSHTDPHGPDASREMVRFFFEQQTSN
jgi:poly(hydroxyalkanoate) depolymerase family esterase